MAEDVQPIPLEGPGSKTPNQIPTLHGDPTKPPVGGGGQGVKAKGLPGAPLGGGEGGLGGGGLPGLDGTPEMKTPEDLLMDRSKDRLKEDIKDISVQFYSEQDQEVPKDYNVNDIDFDYVIDRLINQKGWHVNRLKELLPSRDEKEIKKFLSNLVNSKTSNGSNEEENNVDLFNNNLGSNDIMTKGADIVMDNGAIKIASTEKSELLNQMSSSIVQLRQARKNFKKAFLVKVGFDALQGMGGENDLDDAGMDMSLGIEAGPEGDSFDISTFSDGLDTGGDLKSLIDKVKEALDNLTSKVEEFGATSDTMTSDDMLKGDALVDKAEDEIDGAEKDLDFADSFDSKPKDKKDKSEKKDDVKDEKKDDEGDKGLEKVASAGEQFNPEERGKKINPSVPDKADAWSQKGGKGESEGGDAMKAATGKEAQLEEIKAKLAEIKRAKEISMNKLAEYPPKDLNKQEQTDVNSQTASQQASEINSDMKGGFQVPDESLGITGEGNKKDPGMDISEPADMKKSASTEFNKVAAAANSLARKVTAETTAKSRVSMELASIQQLKGLLTNPLKEDLVNKFAEYGVNKVDAQAIVHNAFVNSYEDTQKIVIAEAFDTLVSKDDDEFVKVASFTHAYKVASSDEEITEDNATDDIKEASSDQGTVKTAALRGSQVNKDNSQQYTNFWVSSYKESKGL